MQTHAEHQSITCPRDGHQNQTQPDMLTIRPPIHLNTITALFLNSTKTREKLCFLMGS